MRGNPVRRIFSALRGVSLSPVSRKGCVLHQKVSHGEVSCFGHDPEHGVIPIDKHRKQRRSKPYNKLRAAHLLVVIVSCVTFFVAAVIAPSAKPGTEARIWIPLMAGSLIIFMSSLITALPLRRRPFRKPRG